MYIECPTFGKCLEELLTEVIADRSVLHSALVARVIAAAGEEWASLCCSYNGGNDTQRNLSRSGRIIDGINYACVNATLCAESINWEAVLHDVKVINRVVRFEIAKNTYVALPYEENCYVSAKYRTITPSVS